MTKQQDKVDFLDDQIGHLAAENKRLRAALAVTLDWATYETEYDGRMYEICHSCGGQDGVHKDGCELPAFRALSLQPET